MIFEGALLTLNEKQEDEPEELKFAEAGRRWHGITEVRRITWRELETISNFLIEELDEHGFEHLALTYIPMSKQQKTKLSKALNFLEAFRRAAPENQAVGEVDT